jgi:hypothetical protein
MDFRKPLSALAVIVCMFLCSSAFAAYIDNGDGTVTDTGTGLMWQQARAPITYTWTQALNYCGILSLAGYTDWRLPTAKELASLVDTSRTNPAINTTFFPSPADNYFWSSTTQVDSTNSFAFGVYFYGGYVGSNDKTYYCYVRAVRSGQAGSVANLTLWPVPDTGLTTCYNLTGIITCPQPGQVFDGQDASYSINTPSYTKLAADCTALPDNATTWDMVRDEVTGLVWEEKHAKDGVKNYADPNDADNTYTWYDGTTGTPGTGTDTLDFINDLNTGNYGGYSDWRLPTEKELQSIVDYGQNNPTPAINNMYFSNTVSSDYWAFPTFAGNSGQAWYVDFDHGSVYYYPKSYVRYARAVRSGQCGTTTSTVPTTTSTIQPSPEEDFTYTVSNNAVTITGYTGSGGAVGIPDTIAGMPVVYIGDYAFSGKTTITGISIPGSVATIGMYAFAGCSSLTSLFIMDGVTNIMDGAFQNCSSLGRVTLPGSVTRLMGYSYYCYEYNHCLYGYGSFQNCSLLSAVYFMGDAPQIAYQYPIQYNPFYNSASGLIVYYTSGATGFSNPWYGCPTAVFTPTSTTTTTVAPLDADGDGIADGTDNCPSNYNPQQLDADTDGIGDVCDTTPGCGGCGQTACEDIDADNDGIADNVDNCPSACNSQQLDADGDGAGDVCDTTPGCGGCGQAACEAVCAL